MDVNNNCGLFSLHCIFTMCHFFLCGSTNNAVFSYSTQ